MKSKLVVVAVAMTIAMTVGLLAQTAPTGYTDTPSIPGSKWRVHDDARPRPPEITPGTFSTQQTPGKPPSDAVVLFDGSESRSLAHGKGRTCEVESDKRIHGSVAWRRRHSYARRIRR